MDTSAKIQHGPLPVIRSGGLYERVCIYPEIRIVEVVYCSTTISRPLVAKLETNPMG